MSYERHLKGANEMLMKTTMSEIKKKKNMLNGINDAQDIAEETISAYEDRTMKSIQKRKQKKWQWGRRLGSCRTNSSNIIYMRF